MDFLNFFGLKEDPFKLTPDPAYFYPSSSHNEGLLLMDYSIEQKEGFLLLIGDPGAGKTTLLNVFLEKWRSRAEIAIILTPRLSPEEFLISVAEDLNINLENKNKNEIIKALRDFMIKKSLEGKRVIIVVDEAQNLPDNTLEELRLLSNLETDKEKLLQIILIGQPELESKLMTDKLRQLNQRITTRIHLDHFNRDETLDYINCRLIKAGKKNLKIHKKVSGLTHKLSNGIPRLINMLISRALMAGYLEESNTIHPRHIYHAVKSLSHSDIKIQKQNRLVPVTIGLLLSLLIGAGVYVYLQYVKGFPETAEQAQMISIPHGMGEPLSRDKPVQRESEQIIRNKALPVKTDSNMAENEEENVNKEIVKERKIVEEKQMPAFRFILVKVDIANIREGPSLTSQRVGRSVKGSRYVVLQEASDSKNTKWYQILHSGGEYWISDEVVDVFNLESNPRTEN